MQQEITLHVHDVIPDGVPYTVKITDCLVNRTVISKRMTMAGADINKTTDYGDNFCGDMAAIEFDNYSTNTFYPSGTVHNNPWLHSNNFNFYKFKQ